MGYLLQIASVIVALVFAGEASAQLAPGAVKCRATNAAPTNVEGKPADISCDLAGNIRTSSGGGGGGAATIADGADVAEGATADAAITTNTTGTVSGKLRGLVAILADVWDGASHFLKVSIQNATLEVTQSGSWSVTATQATGTNLHTVVDSGTVAATQSGTWNLNNISGTVSLPTGAATESTLSTLDGKIPASPSQEHTGAASPSSVRLSDGAAFYKATTPSDTQPISAVALPLPSGAATEATLGNVLTTTAFQARINTQGQKTMSASTPVVLPSDQTTLPVASAPQSTTVQTAIGSTPLSTVLLASSSVRQTYRIVNQSTRPLCVVHGATAYLNACTAMIPPFGEWQVPDSVSYRGVISGRWLSGAVGEAIINDIPGG